MNYLKIFLLSFVLVFGSGTVILAQEEITEPPTGPTEVEEVVMETVNLDEDIQPEDLEVKAPRLLPDSPFYFLKNWARGIQSVFAFNPVKKAELRMKFANEKLMEAKKIVQEGKDPEKIKKATENYQGEIERIKEEAEKIREKAKENPRVESFLDKFIHQQTLHQKLLQRLETQVPSEALEKIEEARERHLERFKDVMLKLEDRKDKITEKLDKILEEQKGSQFKHFRNLEVLKDLEEKMPEEAKEAIQRAQENALKRLKGNLEQMSSEDQEKFKEYIEKISGEKERQLEILENLKAKIEEVEETPKAIELKERLEKGKTKIFEKIEEKLEKLDCPLWTPPAPGFCKEGRVIIEKDPRTGCPLPPKCVVPGEVEVPEKPEKPTAACITLWDPVCGRDGKTYSNACFARLAGMEVASKGVCEKESGIGVEEITFFYLSNQIRKNIKVKVWADDEWLFTKEIEAERREEKGIEVPPVGEYPAIEVKAFMKKGARWLKVGVEFPVGSALAGKEKRFEIAKIPGEMGFRIIITTTDILATRDYLPIR